MLFKLNNKGGAILYFLLVLLILMAVGLSLFVYYYKNYVDTNIENNETSNEVTITNDDKVKIINHMNYHKDIISKIIYKQDSEGNIVLIENENLLSDKNKQLYTFIFMDQESEYTDLYVTYKKDNNEYKYLPLENFSNTYKVLFNEEFIKDNRIISDTDNDYDKGDYVYYDAKSIVLKSSITNFEIQELVYDDSISSYSAKMGMSISGEDNAKDVIVTYQVDNDNIYVKEIRIKNV